MIVSCNLQDFPKDTIAPCGIEVLYPDNFLSSHIDLMPGPFCDAVRQIRERLVTSLICDKDYFGTLAAPGLVATAAILARFWERHLLVSESSRKPRARAASSSRLPSSHTFATRIRDRQDPATVSRALKSIDRSTTLTDALRAWAAYQESGNRIEASGCHGHWNSYIHEQVRRLAGNGANPAAISVDSRRCSQHSQRYT